MANDKLVDNVVPYGFLIDRKVAIIMLQPSSLGLGGSEDKGRDDGGNPAIAEVREDEPGDAFHDDDVGQEEKEEQVVGFEKVHVLSSLLQGPEVLSDLRAFAPVQAGLLWGQLTNQQGLQELAHEIQVQVEGTEGIRSIFSRIVSDDTVPPWVPLGPFGNVVDLAVDDEPPVGAQVVLLNLLPAEGGHRSLELGAPLSLVTSLPHAACLPG